MYYVNVYSDVIMLTLVLGSLLAMATMCVAPGAPPKPSYGGPGDCRKVSYTDNIHYHHCRYY